MAGLLDGCPPVCERRLDLRRASATTWPRWRGACEAIASHPGTGYRFSRERVAVDGDLVQQLVVWRPAGSAGRRVPRLLRGAAG